MDVQKFVENLNADFYCGVPDSLLKALCNYLYEVYGKDSAKHIVAANEGNCVALAAGYHMATGKIPVVYLQNSGEGNIINPVASLLNDKVYAIPMIFVIGWRGEPGVHDEPQHKFQGEITLKLLEDLDIAYLVIDKSTDVAEIRENLDKWKDNLAKGKQVAFVVKKGALEYNEKVKYENPYKMTREQVIKHITEVTAEDIIISTTGKASRELFEIREAEKQSHKYDFLTVGSMGHSSSIALGIALNKPASKIWCIDGDGAMLMHMGSMAVIGAHCPKNLVHIVINNGSHETVGGMPTVANKIDIPAIALACGYKYTVKVDNFDDLDKQLKFLKQNNCLSLLEVKCSLGARADLGRPTTTALQNKTNFMNYLSEKK